MRGTRAPKALKNVRKIFRGDALACVGNGNFQSPDHTARRHRDRATGGRVAQGVGQQITQHLRYTVGVSLDRREIIGELSFEDENAR